ncbi:hypothetical protein FIM1_3 [Kluyveromyces marxianus]|uniref:Uncharacterized protein n=1 Tax=Kluyveromyces marxianus TaxID=4911 RepID=A0ABX6ENF5_KLUMA|nr:hypothetical protein FIM1_3 [Kluyveromyces marxianus]
MTVAEPIPPISDLKPASSTTSPIANPSSKSQQYTFSYLNKPKSRFTLPTVQSPWGYNVWLREFCKALRKQGLGYLLPLRDGTFSHVPEDDEKDYITRIHSACVPPDKCPKWLKLSPEDDASIVDCFLQAVKKINAEEYPTNIVDEMAALSLLPEESLQNFLKRAKDLQRRASNANFPGVDQILIDKTLITLPETYHRATVTFYDQKDRSFKRFMEILSETETKISDGKEIDTNTIKKEVLNLKVDKEERDVLKKEDSDVLKKEEIDALKKEEVDSLKNNEIDSLKKEEVDSLKKKEIQTFAKEVSRISMPDEEPIHDFLARMGDLYDRLARADLLQLESQMVANILRALPKKFELIVATFRLGFDQDFPSLVVLFSDPEISTRLFGI